MGLEYLSLKQYAALPSPEARYLIDRFLPLPGRVLLVGPAKVGKSYLALQMGLAVATGTSFLGRPALPNGRRVLYLQFDMPHVSWLERMQRLQQDGVALPDFRPTQDTGDFVVLGPSSQRPYLDVIHTPDDVAYLIQVLADLHPALVIVDTLAKLHTSEEKDERAMKKVFHTLNAIFADCCILYVHHTRKLSPPAGMKAQSRPTPGDAARGSSFMAGDVDMIGLLYNRCLTTEGRFDEDGAYHCTQDPLTNFWIFPEASRLVRLEEQCRLHWASATWAAWPDYRRSVMEHYPHVPDHLLSRLRRDLAPLL